ncbi:MAG TPA: BrnT family toxin [Hyphomicrobiaceae bacterium]|nr:BrnT family toxin [Hyphomicrobiaceae bacterium]
MCSLERSSRERSVGTRKVRFRVCEEQFEEFEWDETKRQRNIDVHGIDFEDAATIFGLPYLRDRSDKKDEPRFVAIGRLTDVEIAVVYTVRDGVCRIISARRARTNEREEYHEALSRRGEAGED